MKLKSKWYQADLSLFNYQDDARSNKHKIYIQQYASYCHGAYFFSLTKN